MKIDTSKREYKDGKWTLDGIDFDGHFVEWGFSYEPETYLKESQLSGDEWRKGGYVKIFINGECVLKEFCREPERAVFLIAEFLPKLQECEPLYPMGVSNKDWKEKLTGRKIYHGGVESIVDRVCEDGEIIVRTEDGKPYEIYAHKKEERKEDPENYEDEWKDKDRIHITDSRIYWFRN